MDFVGSYHEPPPPPPDPPPDIPPPDDEEELLDGLEVIALLAEFIVEFINVLNDNISNGESLSYYSGALKVIDSNFLIHLSDTPNT